MTAQPIRPLRQLPVIIQEPTRFENRRQAAAERAGLEYAQIITKEAKDRLERAESLFQSAAAMDPLPRLQATQAAIRAVQDASAALAEVLVEYAR